MTITDRMAAWQRKRRALARRYPDHTVMMDPEGNEFCVEPGPA